MSVQLQCHEEDVDEDVYPNGIISDGIESGAALQRRVNISVGTFPPALHN